jgi:hypothetical protein
MPIDETYKGYRIVGRMTSEWFAQIISPSGLISEQAFFASFDEGRHTLIAQCREMINADIAQFSRSAANGNLEMTIC